MNTELHKTLKIPPAVEQIEDVFSKELVDLWKSRKLEGIVYTKWLYSMPVAYLMLETRGQTAIIRGLFTAKPFRGNGLATELLTEVLQECDEIGRLGIIVNITEGAEKLYERFGFNILGRRKDFPDQSIAIRGCLTDSEERSLEKKLYHETVNKSKRS